MAKNPLNLLIRFLLEMLALVLLGYWGWSQAGGWLRYLLAIGIPLGAAVLWGTFNVPDDPSRSGRAPVRVPGWLRLFLELAFFAFAAWGLYDAGSELFALIFAAIVLVHYAISYDRILWLLKAS
jgi:hypothetical protein